MANNYVPQRFYDTHIIYCDSGVASSSQVSESLKKAIADAEKVLKRTTNCRFKINLLVNREGEYFGYGYIWVSSEEIYWMLLGRNPDGTERIREYPDPNWSPPSKKEASNGDKNWIDIVEDEDAFIQPMIKEALPPLVTIPGYEYDEEQITHLEELSEDGNEIPKIGYFEIGRGYAIDAPPGTLRHKICARNVPSWIPENVFKNIFSFYVRDSNNDYPKVNIINSKKGKIVFISFEPGKKDALFTLLMTKKITIVNPQNKSQKSTLVFTHAFDNKK